MKFHWKSRALLDELEREVGGYTGGGGVWQGYTREPWDRSPGSKQPATRITFIPGGAYHSLSKTEQIVEKVVRRKYGHPHP